MARNYSIQKHTDHPTHCYRVVGWREGEFDAVDHYGFGLTFDDAEYLRRQLELDEADWDAV